MNFLRARLFHARVPLANSYLVRMSNRSRYQDEAFEAFIIESETWRERRKERRREEKKEREGKHLGVTHKNFQSMTILIFERYIIKVEMIKEYSRMIKEYS